MTATQDILSPPPPAVRQAAPTGLSALQNHDLNALRSVLLAGERAQIKTILHRLDDPGTRAAELARILPQAIALRSLDDPALAEALRPAIRDALAAALDEHPELLLSAVRIALRDLLFMKPWKLLLTPCPLLRRRRARRGGAAGARIEQLVLIDRASGKLLQQSTLAPADPEDPAHLQEQRSIASMLTTLSQFLQNPSYLEQYLALGQLRVEEFTYGIHATETLLLLSVIRAPIRIAPAELLTTCQEILASLNPTGPRLPSLPLGVLGSEV